MKKQKVIENVKEELRQLRNHTERKMNFIESLNSPHYNTEEARKERWESMEKEWKEGKNFIGTYWFNDYNRKATVEFFDLYEELERSKNQRIKELGEEIKELEEALEFEENVSECHLDALELARQWRIRQSKEKDDNLEKASRQIELLEKIVAWQNYLADKQLQELPSLPKKERKLKLLSNKIKNRIKQVKEITREKFNTYILQKDK